MFLYTNNEIKERNEENSPTNICNKKNKIPRHKLNKVSGNFWFLVQHVRNLEVVILANRIRKKLNKLSINKSSQRTENLGQTTAPKLERQTGRYRESQLTVAETLKPLWEQVNLNYNS